MKGNSHQGKASSNQGLHPYMKNNFKGTPEIQKTYKEIYKDFPHKHPKNEK